MTKFLYILLFICNLSSAQSYYSHYLDNTSEWRYIQFYGGGSSNISVYITEYFDGTEVINNYVYYKLYKASRNMDGSVSVDFSSYIREDIDRNFYKYNTTTNTEEIYLDNNFILNIQNGDQLDAPSYFPICIAQVSYINFAGLTLKKVEKNGANYGFGVEGIGYSKTICYDNPYYYTQLCSYIKQGSTYGSPCGPHPVPVRNNLNITDSDFNSYKIKISPNPTSLNLNIQSESRIRLIDIIDIQGRKLETINLDNFETQINMSKFQNGTYIFKLETELGNLVKKVVKN